MLHIRTRFVHAQQRTRIKNKPLYNSRVLPNTVCARTVKTRAIDMNSLVDTTYFVGKYFMLFVFFYSGLNYLQYRSWRKMMEEDDKDT